MSSTRATGPGSAGNEPLGRLVECLALAGLVLAGHALGGGSAHASALVLLAGATVTVTTVGRHHPEPTLANAVVLAVLAQAAGHLALVSGGGEAAPPSAGRMLAGHAVSTAVVVALARHGRLCWHRAARLLGAALHVWRASVLPPPPHSAGPGRCRGTAHAPAAGRHEPGTVARRGPPAGRCAAYA